jgi:hypothetical protein
LKKPFKNTQQLESPVFFLDRNLGLKLAAILRLANFDVIAHQEHYGPEAQKISDPEVISECGRLKYPLLTADGNMPFTFASEIRNAKIAVFLLSNNHEGPEVWGPRVISAKLDMEREWYGRAKPYTAHINREGRVSYVMRYYRKKVKKTSLQKRDHLEFSYEAPLPDVS